MRKTDKNCRIRIMRQADAIKFLRQREGGDKGVGELY